MDCNIKKYIPGRDLKLWNTFARGLPKFCNKYHSEESHFIAEGTHFIVFLSIYDNSPLTCTHICMGCRLLICIIICLLLSILMPTECSYSIFLIWIEIDLSKPSFEHHMNTQRRNTIIFLGLFLFPFHLITFHGHIICWYVSLIKIASIFWGLLYDYIIWTSFNVFTNNFEVSDRFNHTITSCVLTVLSDFWLKTSKSKFNLRHTIISLYG